VYLLGSTADQYFSPALAKVADSLKLSSTVAGVSLLAFGNGAPDVFSSILAARKLKVSLSLGGLFGGAFFVSSVVLGRVILSADICKVDQNKTLRDSSLLILTIILIVIYGLIGTITLFQACLFPILYCFYVFLVLYMEKNNEPLINRSVEMPDMNTNYSQFGEIIEDYILLSPTKLKVMPIVRHDDFEWSQIKEKFFTQKK